MASAKKQSKKATKAKKSKIKNIVLLAMSKLPATIRESKFVYPGKKSKKGYIYYSQLEPISRMIKEREGTLDHVFILATQESLQKKSIQQGLIYGNNPYTTKKDYDAEKSEKISAVDFYKKRLGLTPKSVDVIEINKIQADSTQNEKSDTNTETTNDIGQAINDTVRSIYDYYENNKDCDIRLWVDTQGAFREINLAMNAIVNSLEGNGEAKVDNNISSIVPKAFYYVEYDESNKINHIKDQTSSYQVFEFVSGINELRAYGRADQLVAYYTKRGEVPAVISCIKKVSDAMLMCNVKEFNENLIILRDEWVKFRENSENMPLLDIFADQIEADYGKLLENAGNAIDIVEWMCNKKLYQQTLTYIESIVPHYWKRIGLVGKLSTSPSSRLANIGKKYFAGEPLQKTIKILANDKDTFFKLLKIFADLKDLRNKYAHMLRKHETEEELRHQLSEFIELARKVEEAGGDEKAVEEYRSKSTREQTEQSNIENTAIRKGKKHKYKYKYKYRVEWNDPIDFFDLASGKISSEAHDFMVEKETTGFIESFTNVAKSIEALDFETFAKKLEKLQKEWQQLKNTSSDNPQLLQFVEKMTKSHDKLLENNGIADIIEWMCDNELYKHTVAYISSTIPEYLMNNNCFKIKDAYIGDYNQKKNDYATKEEAALVIAATKIFDNWIYKEDADGNKFMKGINQAGLTASTIMGKTKKSEIKATYKDFPIEILSTDKNIFLQLLFFFVLANTEYALDRNDPEREKNVERKSITKKLYRIAELLRILANSNANKKQQKKNSAHIAKANEESESDSEENLVKQKKSKKKYEPTEEEEQTPTIKEIGCKKRVIESLERIGITHVEQLANLPLRTVFTMPKIGRGNLLELLERMKKAGYDLFDRIGNEEGDE